METLNYKKAYFMAAAIAFTLSLVALLNYLTLFDFLELRSFDHRSQIYRADKAAQDDIVVVLLDEASLQQMQTRFGRWPWPRSAYNEVLTFFSNADAQVVGFDILFSEQQNARADNADDAALVKATKQAANVLHAMQLTDIKSSFDEHKPLPDDFIKQHQVHNIRYLGKQYSNYLIPFNGLYQASKGVGVIEIEPDSDGIYRRLRLFNEYQGAVFPALSAAVILPLLVGDNAISYGNGQASLAGIEVALNDQQQYLINPVGQFHTVSIAQVFNTMSQLKNGQKQDLTLNPADFKDKIILIGASAIGLLDVKATALSAAEPGVFLHAAVISNFLEMDFINQPSSVKLALLHVLVALLSVLSIVLISRLLLALALPSLLFFLYVIAAYLSFADNLLLPIASVSFTFGFAIFVAIYYRLSKEKQHKQRIHGMFSQYVSEDVLNNVLDSEGVLDAGLGQTENLTILFSDVRNFTNFSETYGAKQVVEILNIYFSHMTHIVFDHSGTLNKFIGDALMAFWGAPIKTKVHADEALFAAILMRQDLANVNAKLLQKGYQAIDIGIGLHTGDVVLGNIGSFKKLEYTIIGDAVNLASRVEGLTKQYGVSILLTEATVQSLSTSIPCIKVDNVRVKGKQVPVVLFTPATTFITENELTMQVDELVALSDRIYACFQNQQWAQAKKDLFVLKETMLFSIINKRCDDYLNNPPNNQWDGVYEHSQK